MKTQRTGAGKLFRKECLAIFLILLVSILWTDAYSEPEADSPDDIGSGFFLIQGGMWRHLGSTRDRLLDPGLFYLQVAWSVSRELGYEEDYKALKAGFRLGFGMEGDRGAGRDKLFTDLLLKLRYTFFSSSFRLRPWIEFGPGVLTYRGTAFQAETGVGLDYHFPSTFLGFGVQYKEVLGSGDYARGVLFLGTVGYSWD